MSFDAGAAGERSCGHPDWAHVDLIHETGDVVCELCGVVVLERQLVAAEGRGAGESAEGLHYWQVMREALYDCLARSHMTCHRAVERALELARRSTRLLGIRAGRRGEGDCRPIVAVCLYSALVEDGIFRLPAEVSRMMDIPYSKFIAAENRLSAAGLGTPYVSHAQRTSAICRHLGVRPAFETSACWLAEQMERYYFGHAADKVAFNAITALGRALPVGHLERSRVEALDFGGLRSILGLTHSPPRISIPIELVSEAAKHLSMTGEW